MLTGAQETELQLHRYADGNYYKGKEMQLWQSLGNDAQLVEGSERQF